MRGHGLVGPPHRGRLHVVPDLPALGQPLAARAGRGRAVPARRRRARTSTSPSALRDFAYRADREVEGTRWSFYRDIGPARRRDARLARRPRARAGRAQHGRPARDALDRGARAPATSTTCCSGTSLPLFLTPGAAPPRGVERGGLRRRLGPRRGVGGGEDPPGRRPRALGGVPRLLRVDVPTSSARSAPASTASRRRRSSRCRATCTTPTSPRSPTGAGPACARRSGRRSARRSATRSTSSERRMMRFAASRAGRRGRAAARAQRAASRRRRCAGATCTTSRGSTTRSRRWCSRAAAPRSCSRRPSRRPATTAELRLERVFEHPLTEG